MGVVRVRDVALVVLGAVLGALLALIVNRVESRRKERKQQRQALRRVSRMLSAVRAAVAHGHDFSNKSDWYRELKVLARKDRQWLDDLYEPTCQIAWHIRDHSFDHEKSDAEKYCCDELLVDLSFLELSLLPLVRMGRDEREAITRKLAREIVTNRWGVLPQERVDPLVDEFLEKWRRGDLALDSKYAISPWVNSQTGTP